MADSGKSFLMFRASRWSDFRRIAGSSRGDYTADDVFNEAWLVAYDIGRKRGFAVDFLNPEDQELILGCLYNNLVNFSEKTVRYAVKLDKDWDSEDSESPIDSLARLLTAPRHCDPFHQLQAAEKRSEPPELVRHSYSQASAYVILLHRFDWELDSLAEDLRMVISTLRRRMIASGIYVKRQPSLFDRIQVIDSDFLPTRGYGVIAMSMLQEDGPQQLAWDFPEADDGDCRVQKGMTRNQLDRL